MTKKTSQSPIMIFVDMDDVLTQWSAYAQASSADFRAGNMPDFYRSLDEAWWENIPPFDGARDFYDALCDLGTTKILSGVLYAPECYSGKAKWLLNFFDDKGPFSLRDFIPCASRDKHLLAQPDRILIDDRQSNITAWENAGGIGILHTGDYEETLKKLKAAIATYQNQNTSKNNTDKKRAHKKPPNNRFGA